MAGLMPLACNTKLTSAAPMPRKIGKSFLLLFFKKEVLPLPAFA
jgi:hypothetical protein